MGHKREMICTECSYRVVTSGGPDMGFFIKTDTFICRDCHELTDVTISNNRGRPDPGESNIKCGRCSGSNIIKWDHRKKPCPKCGGKMKVNPEGQSYLWD